MLRGASLHFAAQGNSVSVVARNSRRLNALAKEPRLINPIAVDYRDEAALRSKLEDAVNVFGSISLAVCWIRSIAPQAGYIVAEVMNKGTSPCRYFDILGSATADPSTLNSRREADFRQFQHIEYRKIILGFIIKNGGTRWLTNDEISAGVINAVEIDAKGYIIGTVHPWSMRP